MTDRTVAPLRISEPLLRRVICPSCAAGVRVVTDNLECTAQPAHRFPIRDGVPLLLDRATTPFADEIERAPNSFARSYDARGRRLIRMLRPDVSANLAAGPMSARICRTLEARHHANVLVLGAGERTSVIEDIRRMRNVEVVESDVLRRPQTTAQLDAHAIPFADETFDLVVAQALLEHVLDPSRCVSEIERVLRWGGLVYAETPFLQPIHGGRYDFTRWTALGHRRLFRMFRELDAVPASGPGSTLAWAWEYFWMSFARTRRSRTILRVMARASAIPLKHLDRLLLKRPGGSDAAAAYAFLGERVRGYTLTDSELLHQYRGMAE